MKSKNIYDLALLKHKREKEEIELFIRGRNDKKKRLLLKIQKEEETKKDISKRIGAGSSITPDLIHIFNQLEMSKKNDYLAEIEKINREIKAVQKNYLEIKNKMEKIENRKIEKQKQNEKYIEKRMEQRSFEEYLIDKVRRK